MTSVDFISAMGGLLGLFLGFSVISAMEIFYWCFFKIIKKMILNAIYHVRFSNLNTSKFNSPIIYSTKTNNRS